MASAIDPVWVSPLTYDAGKIIATIGGGVHINEHWRADALFGLALLNSTTVDPSEAQVPRVNPVRGNPTASEAVNGGDYSARAIVIGLGANYKF